MAQSIPASNLVAVQPGVISAGGSPLSLNSIFLTQNTSVPTNQIANFANYAAVAAYFGALSQEAILAQIYFNGYDAKTITPGNLMFYQFPAGPVAAYLRGLSNGITLAQVQAIVNAVVTASIAGTTLTVTAVTSGALAVNQLLTGTGVSVGTRIVAQLTGTAGGVGTYTVSISQTVASVAITGAYDLSVAIDGVTKSFATVSLAAATSLSNAASLIQTALGLTGAQSVTYSSQFGAFVITSGTTGLASTLALATGGLATALGLGAGATLSQGAIAVAEATAMNAVAVLTQNWAAFMTVYEPTLASKLAFALWTNGTNARYMFVCWDTDPLATQNGNTTGFGPSVQAANYTGSCPVSADGNVAATLGVTLASLVSAYAAFICGTTASINFNQPNGRLTYAFKGQSGLNAGVVDATTAANLVANGYNYYGSFATANQQFTQLQPGQISGVWKWIDAYVNQIYLNSQLQLAGMVLLAGINSLPYNADGYQTLRDTFNTPIQQAILFGSIRIGVPLSSAQAAQVNAAAGNIKIDNVLTNNGFYLQILPATSQVRGNRGTPPCNLFYMDGGSIQKINLASIDVM